MNFADFIQFFVYLTHFIMITVIINNADLTSDTLIIINGYFEVVMVILALIKFIQLLASFEKLSILVILI